MGISGAGDMITSLHIKNMRCFRDFSLNNAGRITLISGENNVGKSALLESVYLLLAYDKPELFIMLNALRGIQPAVFSPELLWEPFFHGLNMSEELSVACLAEEERSVFLAKDDHYASLHKNKQLPPTGLPAFAAQPNLQLIDGGYSLKITYTEKLFQAIGHCLPQGNGLGVQWDAPMRPTRPYVYYIGPRVFEHGNSAVQLFGKAELAGNKKRL
jgi:hypothetical protein